MMGAVVGYYLAHPNEPSVYVTGDTVLTKEVLDALSRLRPDVVVAPAGAANFGIGGDILFSPDELVELARQAPGEVIFNHLEALDHCSITRAGLRQRMESEDLGARVHIPEDGEVMHFERRASISGSTPSSG
jgi:L-ascorbate metabolism protein UlaG (beta-lactamase superfamily)